MSGRPRVAVIGCGKIGTGGHLPAFAAAARDGLCTLAAICDVDLTRAEAAARPYDLPAFASVEELLHRARPDVVSIATLPSTHRELTLQALDAGCHVLCEKPIAMNAREVEQMVAAADRAGRLLSICFECRYWDEAVWLRQRIAAGDFGHVHFIRTWGGAVHSFPSHMSRHQVSVAGGGVLTHWTIHNLDLALWLLGSPDCPEPLTASAVCHQRLNRLPQPPPGWTHDAADALDPHVEDFAVGLVRLAGNTVVTVEANWLQPPSSRPEGWEILADRAAASISPLRLWLQRGGAWVDETPPPGTLAPCDYDMRRLMAGFLRQVHAGGPSPVTGPEVVRIQRLMDALYASAAEGREVSVPPVGTKGVAS